VDEAAEAMLVRFKLETYRAVPASVLPEGVRKLLDIAMALVSRPKVLLLDEPTSGVSAEEKFALMDLVLAAIQGEGATVLFVEHDMDIVRRYAQRLIAFYEGRIIADGRPEPVLSDSEVRKLVVGEEGARARAAGGSAC
jgi:branched-chain amino acid transport system ATP-binding protein